MRTTTILAGCFFLLAVSFQLAGQHREVVRLEFGMDQFQIVTTPFQTWRVEPLEEGFFFPEGPSKPALPWKEVRVLVPNGAVLTGMDPRFTHNVAGRSVTLAAVPLPVPTLPGEPVTGGETVFPDDFPDRQVIFNGTMIQRGFTWFSFSVYPFRYDSRTRELLLAVSVELEVRYMVSPQETSAIMPEQSLLHSLGKEVANPEALSRHYSGDRFRHLKSSGERIDYLVVTSEALREEFSPLLEWKTRKGLTTGLITMEEIAGRYSGATIQLKLKNCLHDYYLNHGLTWALLGGDDQVVPVQGCYGKVIMKHIELTDYHIPADLFYACFDRKFDWNSTVDNMVGQVYHDDVDLIPEIYISRIPVRTKEHARSFVSKTLTYEKNPPPEGFTEELLLAGVKSWNEWEGKSDNHHRSEYLFSNYINRHWTGSKVGFFDTGSDFHEDHEYDVTNTNLSGQLNSGYGIFHFAGHGNNIVFVMESGGGFSRDDAAALKNPCSGLVLSNACDVNAFDSIDPCLSEAFLRNPDGGAVAFFGSARYGFGNPGQSATLGPSLQFNARFMKHLFDRGEGIDWNSFATVASLSKQEFTGGASDGGSSHYLLYSINAMGDPELPIYTARPSRFDNVRIYRMGNSLTVNTAGEENCRISVTSLDLSEGYQEVVEGVSYHTFEQLPASYQVTVTAPNYMPYTYISGNLTGMGADPGLYIRVFPNPVTDFLHIHLDLSGGQAHIFDLHGKMIEDLLLSNGSNRIRMSEYPPGTYLIKCRTSQGTTWHKIMKP